MMKRTVIGIGLAAMVWVGCATGRPAWTTKGAGAFPPSEKVFYGIGRADASIQNESLRVETADNRARGDLQKVFDTFSETMMRDYNGMDGQVIERGIKTFSAGHISGAQIVDRYTDSKGTAFSLLKLDLESFKKAIEMSQELSSQAKEFVRKRSDALFSDMQKEEEKRGVH